MMATIQKITPHLWYNKEAKEAAEYYVSVFPDSSINSITTIENTPSGTVEQVEFVLSGLRFIALSAGPFFKFNESVSFMVACEDQEEIDYYWEKLSADPEAEQCGWLKDKYGLSWQIVPAILDNMMIHGTREQRNRVVQAFLKMKKMEIEPLKRAYDHSGY